MNEMILKDLQTHNNFYGRRKGPTLSLRKKHLLENTLPKLKINVSECEKPLNPRNLFSAYFKEVWLEIGFGKGEHVAWQALNNKNVGILGCEPFINGVAGLLSHIEEQNINNIKIYDDDARHLLKVLEPESIGRTFLLHPDPWPKNRHQGRRFVSQKNLEELARVMKDGAELRIGTDHMGYARWTISQMLNHPLFEWQAENSSDWKTPPDDWPTTRYNKKALDIGQDSIHFIFKRRPR